MNTRPSIDKIVDAFVGCVNALPRRLLPEWEVPEALRDGDSDADGWMAWRVRPSPDGSPWVAELETKLPGRFPPSFRSLVTRYLFPALEIGPVEVFANTGTRLTAELADAIFADRFLAEPLLRNGFVQIGRPGSGSYDPIAFDLGRRRGGGECPLVRIDHEVALMQGQVRVIEEVAPSFLALIEAWEPSTADRADR